MEKNEVNSREWFFLANDGSPSSNKLKDLEEALAFGNHEEAKLKPKILKELVEKNVTFGYGLVLPLETLNKVPGALIAPVNIMKQNTP